MATEKTGESLAAADAVAQRLQRALETREPIAPLTEGDAGFDVAAAYAAQQAWTERRLAEGETILGRKIGLTSRVVQRQLGVDEPDYGTQWGSRCFPAVGGRAQAPAELFVQPRVEGELAFLLGDPPRGPRVTPQQVLAATEAIAPAIEIVDSRIADWRIALPDTVADNASFGGFVLGAWDRGLRERDLRTVGMVLSHGETPVAEGVGAAALGHPARAVAWLLEKLAGLGVETQPGDIVLSGALGPMTPVSAGDVFTLEVHGQRPLTVAFA